MRLCMGAITTATFAVAAMACSASSGGEGRGQGGGTGAVGGGTGAMLGGTGSFGGGTGSTGGGTGSTGGGTGGSDLGDGGGFDPDLCGGERVEPEVIEVTMEVTTTRAEPMAIYIMLDQSGSMVPLWPGAVQAITDFVNDPASEGLDVALGLFPPAGFGLDNCSANTYDPPPVPLGRLPGHAAAITGGLPGGPIGIGTPIEGAIKGATQFCRNFTPADPADAGEECIVLFITDGAPSGCAEDTPTIVAAASSAGVPVYTIALNGVSDLNLLNMIASATGTDCGGGQAACDLTGGGSFIDALTSIRDDVVSVETVTELQTLALTCEWGIPEPTDDTMPFDKELVNVIFRADPAQDGQTFANVPTMGDCGSNAAAWYYDDPDAPQRIHACPATCTALEAAEMGAVEIQLGCPIVLVE